MLKRLIGLTLFFNILLAGSYASHATGSLIQEVKRSELKTNKIPLIKASHYRLVKIDLSQVRDNLRKESSKNNKTKITLIELPLPDGTNHKYQLIENSTMSPELAKKFPEIKSYDAYGVTDPQEFVKFDISSLGLHAMIQSPGKPLIYVDPAFKNDTNYYIVYNVSDSKTTEIKRCGATQSSHFLGTNRLTAHTQYSTFNNFSSCFLRKYRLAVAANPGYTAFFGGVNKALAAQVATINRVNGIYEAEFGVTLEIVGNNEKIIFTLPYPPGVIPYSGESEDADLDQNQANIDFVIGKANYDIGHLFFQGSQGGYANIGQVCLAATKAQGVSRGMTPVGYTFDRTVLHEIGHQFGAEHVQNNWDCSPAIEEHGSVEPGSGSTIMSYAGLCWPNVQDYSDPYFNGINLKQIGDLIGLWVGSCAVATPIAPAPIVDQPQDIIIPVNTPFSLTASANGVGSANYTYAWEQQNYELTYQPPLPNTGSGPNFRSILPSRDNTRYFPSLKALANNGPYKWEVLSSVDRTMRFRVTVRSNRASGSCNAYKDMSVKVRSSIGPFKLLYPSNANISWKGNSEQNIKWQVARTDSLDGFVDILLSIDGGITYPITLASNVVNSGSYHVFVPAVKTNNARIMVRAVSGNFLTVSRNNFKIVW